MNHMANLNSLFCIRATCWPC